VLDAEVAYSSDGTQMLSTLGPQHAVKLSSGSEVQARSHEVYSYNEGAPLEGGPYDLVTKSTAGAQYAGKEEDVRTTITSYSGQENLGWKLRKPTSVTSDPSGLKLTHTTLYEASSGEVSETRMPSSPGASRVSTANAKVQCKNERDRLRRRIVSWNGERVAYRGGV